MRLAVFENIMTPGGHEVDFDRIIVEEFRRLGHEVSFYVPEDFRFAFDYHVPVKRLRGTAINYAQVRGLKKLLWSLRREMHRQSWYKQLYEEARSGKVDAILVPTSTWRYQRALARNVLKNSPVPLVFILHGINPGEAPKFFREAEKLLPNGKIRLVVLTFGDSIFGRRADNVYPMYPPAYTPRDVREIPPRRKLEAHEPLTIGFFGQYRREKRLEDFLKVFEEGSYTRPVKLLVQGSTMHPEDAEDFERIIAAHQGDSRMEFLHKGLIGEEWQRAILGVDALLMPYSAPRYLYHWGGMLFTAIGCERPVVASDDINPEVFREFHIGETFRSGDMGDLKRVLEEFINGFDERADTYEQELRKAAEEFSPENFAGRLEQVMNNDNFRG